MTIHKSQGLTLREVVVDAGDDELAMGQLFVALSRVRHPDHFAFDPFPSVERVTTMIARKASLRQRKEHEVCLRRFAARTRHRFAELSDAASVSKLFVAVSQLLADRRVESPPPPPDGVSVSGNSDDSDCEVLGSTTSCGLAGRAGRGDRPSPAEHYRDTNLERAEGLGVSEPSDQWRVADALRSCVTRTSVVQAEARVVDYLGAAGAFSWTVTRGLRSLGFDVRCDISARQVCVRVVATLPLAVVVV